MSKTKKSTDTTQDKYVVLRNGRLVSDAQYASIKEANDELQHWQRITTRWPDGTKITVAKFDPKSHF